MTWPQDNDSDYYAFEPERFLIPPMEGFLRRILGASWGLILVSAPEIINLPVILEFLANFSLQQVYYSEFSAEAGDFEKLEGETRKLRTIDEVLEEARNAMSEPDKTQGERRSLRRIEEEFEESTRYQPLHDDPVPRPVQPGDFRPPRNSDLVFIPELSPKLVPRAVEEALTSNLVVSGIRADGSFPALRRFMELLGSEHLAAASLMGIIGLNTVARICPECKVKVEHRLSDDDVLLIGCEEKTLRSFKGTGCDACNKSGYRGRVLIHEGFELSPQLRSGLLKSTPPRQLRMLAKREGMKTLLDAAWTLAETGETSLDEVMRIAEVTDPGGMNVDNP